MITTSTMQAIAESLKTAYGKNGLPCFFSSSYSRRYCSFSRAFTAQTSSLASAFDFSAFSHGGAVVPSLATR